MTTEAGPPEVKAPAEPMNKPEPIAPPLQESVSILSNAVRTNVHSNELHVSALQITMQRPLITLHESMILRVNTELPTAYVITKCAGSMFLIERGCPRFGIHLCDSEVRGKRECDERRDG